MALVFCAQVSSGSACGPGGSCECSEAEAAWLLVVVRYWAREFERSVVLSGASFIGLSVFMRIAAMGLLLTSGLRARWSSTTRLVTRTKEFTECASILVLNQMMRNESDDS